MFVFLSSILGLLVGSFVAGATYRYERGKGFILGRSFCDNCKRELPWYVNIPVLSYVVLRGRSLCCSKKISIRYPLIEIICALGFAVIGFNIFELALFVVFLSIFVIDFETQIIPDELVFISFCLSLFLIGNNLYVSLFSGFIFALFLLLVHLFTKGRGMGLGDIKFAIVPPIVLGLTKSISWMFLSFLTGAIVGIILITLRKAKLKQKIAFGPFLILSYFITYYYGEKIVFWIYPH